MKQNVKLDSQKEMVTANVHALSHDGRGIATIASKTTFIAGALPDEVVTYKMLQKRSSYNEAELLAVLNPSEKRTKAPCKHFGVCGGCSLQHMDMPSQLALKQQTLLDQLKHFGRVTPAVISPALDANSLGYRRKARLGVKYVIKKNKLLIGFREKASRYLADIEECVVLHPKVGSHLTELSQLIATLACYQHIPQIEVAIGDDEAALIIRHLQPLGEEDHRRLIEFGEHHAFHIYLQPNPPTPVHKIWPLDGFERLSYTLPDYNLEFLFHPLDFTQINLDMNRLMVKQAIDWLDLRPTEKVLDLFCGIGNFTLPISRDAHHVIGVEGGAEMVARAAANADHNKILNTTFYTANLQDADPTAPWMKASYDKILLDPPRTGAKEIISHFSTFNAKRIVYVSCNPATLARDAGDLVHQLGYQLTQVGVMNMFPHTSHIEAMALFEKP